MSGSINFSVRLKLWSAGTDSTLAVNKGKNCVVPVTVVTLVK